MNPKVLFKLADPRAPSKKKAKADECFRCDKKLRPGAAIEGRRGRRYCSKKHRKKAERRECAYCRRDPQGQPTICRNQLDEVFCSPVCRTRHQHARIPLKLRERLAAKCKPTTDPRRS